MLDSSIDIQGVSCRQNILGLIRTANRQLRLPESGSQETNSDKIALSYAGDERRHARMRLRQWAVVRNHGHLPAIARDQNWSMVMLLDHSKSGVGFLSGSQLYPEERLNIVWDMACPREIRIAACRRVGERCYLVGAQYL